MNTPATQRSPVPLAVCGWDEEAREALLALEATGAFAGCAVGDRSGSALVRARRETALPCFQHVSEMVRGAEYEAILFADAEALASGAVVAAARGAHLLVLADRVGGEALASVAAAASANHVPLSLLQPALRDAGVAALPEMIGPGGASYLDVTVEAPWDASHLLRIAVGHVSRLMETEDMLVRASAWAEPHRAYQVDAADGERAASLRVRHAPSPLLRIVAEGTAGVAELMLRDGIPEVRFTSPGGEDLRYRADDVDHWALEAARAADPDQRDDRLRAECQGAFLDAIERAVATGEVQTSACCRRPALHLVEGPAGVRQEQGGRALRPRTGALRLVVS